MTHLHDAIRYYHDLCLTGDLAQASWDIILPGMADRDLMFGTRPLCSVLRPMFHTGLSWHYLAARTELTLRVFGKLSHAMLADPVLRARLYLDSREEELVNLPSGYATNIPTARLDSFFTRHPDGDFTLNFIEFNGESPAGMAYNDVLAELFLDTPLMRRFAERYPVEPIMARRHAVGALLRGYYEWRGGYGKLPDVAILDWPRVPTTSELRLFDAYFRRYGIGVTICTPDELDFHDGRLYAAGRAVDFVWKRVLISELLQRYGLDNPIFDAARAGAICMVNPWNCKLLHKKASFAVASDERHAYLFTPAELDAIRRHIPWTRMVEDRRTLAPDGSRIDLLDWAGEHKDTLVLKPNDEYGGKGVLIGWETDQTDWNTALRNGLTDPTIVQTRALIAYEDFPRLDDQGHVDISRRLVDCDPFLYHGNVAGACLTRLSTVTLLNVTAGGGSTAPAFIVDKA